MTYPKAMLKVTGIVYPLHRIHLASETIVILLENQAALSNRNLRSRFRQWNSLGLA